MLWCAVIRYAYLATFLIFRAFLILSMIAMISMISMISMICLGFLLLERTSRVSPVTIIIVPGHGQQNHENPDGQWGGLDDPKHRK